LKNEGLNFIFKGGTSLILLLSSARRFSIDIDIIVEKDVDIQRVLDRIITRNEVFSRCKAFSIGASV
jgi:predicted nucleotidyltransferase component of viral defense system